MREIARLVVRPSDGEQARLILGVASQSQNLLEPGMVYTLVEFNEGVALRSEGKSCVPRYVNERAHGQTSNVCWGNSVGSILGHGKTCFMTIEEYLKEWNTEP